MIGINQFPQVAMKNRPSIQQCVEVGCYHCFKIYNKDEIKEWTDNDQTAICPFCETDSLIPNMPDYKLTEEILKQANQFWLK